MSHLSNKHGLWILRDAVFLRAEGGTAVHETPAPYRETAGIEDALQATDALLAPLSGHSVTVRLGFPWTRHVVVPWHPRLIGEAEWLTWARAACDEPGAEPGAGLGDGLDNQHIALTPARHGAPRLAIIGNTPLLTALIAQCKSHRVRLIAATSTFAYALHRYRRELAVSGCAPAVHERGMLTCALRDGPSITAITTVAAQSDLSPQIHAVLRCLALAASAPAPETVALIGGAAEPDDRIRWLGDHLCPAGEGGSA